MDNYSLLSSYPDNDNDSISDDSRKIRKQRNTYQKIPDDIRIQLLECVKNGETLKATAKRFKVNYSSAKSILHTYRKEGRILKKVAQERCPKKRDNSSEDDDVPITTKRTAKKENVKATNEECEIPQVAHTERTVSMTTCATLSDENRPTISNIVLPEDIAGSMKMDVPQEGDKVLDERPIMNLISQDHSHGYMTRRKRSIQLMDSFFSQPDFHFPDNGVDNTAGTPYHNDEYSSFNDMMSAFHRKTSYSGDLFNNDYAGFLGTKVLTPVNGQDNKAFKFDHQSENLGHYHFKSFLDTQNLLREAFRKGSVSRYRKNSFDMF